MKIIHNKIQCLKCGDVIESFDVHDLMYMISNTALVNPVQLMVAKNICGALVMRTIGKN